jgi:hypothetical protein
MKTKISFPIDKLTPWHFAVSWAKIILQQKIDRMQENNIPCDYDKEHLERLEDLDMFLQMSWNEFMDNICQTAKEAK